MRKLYFDNQLLYFGIVRIATNPFFVLAESCRTQMEQRRFVILRCSVLMAGRPCVRCVERRLFWLTLLLAGPFLEIKGIGAFRTHNSIQTNIHKDNE